MKLQYKRLTFVAIIFFAIPTLAFASGADEIIPNGESVNDDLTLFEDTTVEEGAVINGNVTVFGSDFESAGTINGDLTIFGGDAEIEGAVTGNVAVIGGDLGISPEAVINGECALIGGGIDVGENGHNCFNPVTSELSLDSFRNVATLGGFVPNVSDSGMVVPESSGSVLSAASSLIFMSLVVGGVAFFMTSAVPNRLFEVRSAVRRNPAAAGGIGLLTTIAGSSFLILTSIIWVPLLVVLTLACGLGVFLGFAGAFYLGVITIMGWTAIGALLAGRFVDQSSRFNPRDPLVAGIGTGLLTMALGLLGIVLPGLTFTLTLILFSVGLGGVVLTKLGRQSFPKQATKLDGLDSVKIKRVMNTLPPE